MKKMFIEAHKMTRKMVEEYGVDYQVQFGLNLSYLLNKKEENKVVKLKGTEKQITLAEKRLEKMAQMVEVEVMEWQKRIDRRPDSKEAEMRKKQIIALRKAFEEFRDNTISAAHIIHCSNFGIEAILKHEGYLK